jgi:AcrR family transcriptional regulator
MDNDGDASLWVGGAGPRVERVRRGRVLEAMAGVIAEGGYESASVRLVCARARVSPRTFYELFGSFEDCFLAILDRGMEVMAGVMQGAFAGEGEGDWLDRMLAGEAAVLSFLDREPQFARVLLVDALGAGSWALARRQDNVGVLRDLIVEQFKDTPLGGDFPPLAASGVMASLLGIMHEHLLHRKPEPLISLLGPLMGVITTPYLSREDVAREIARGEELARRIEAGEGPVPSRADTRGGMPAGGAGAQDPEESVALPVRLREPNARRARECLLFLAYQGERGRSPSNREIAVGVGIAHSSQISQLLSYLLEEGLIGKLSEGVGKRNAWQLTPSGEQAVEELR